MKILLVYAPFCTPATPPYSITNLYSFLTVNGCDVCFVDLNLEFHIKKFEKYGKYFRSFDKNYSEQEYSRITREYFSISEKVYSENNHLVVKGENPEMFDLFFKKILSYNPDVVCFSVVYSSQAFYVLAFLKELKKLGIKTVIGGPAVNSKLSAVADSCLDNEKQLFEFLIGNKPAVDYVVPDFSIHDLKKYFSPMPIIPLKTSSTCYYKQCTFCTHHRKIPYQEYPLCEIKDKTKKYFIIDDMISKKRLLEISDCIHSDWTCQLKPTKDLDFDTLKKLNDSGLKSIMWGVESGNDRILSLIRKGTNVADMQKVLSDSHKAGIKNIVYMIFGFPSETKQEFLETIDFLKNNCENIDLISSSVFGLHENTFIYENYEQFGIKNIIKEERTVLDPKITYELSAGLSQSEANKLRRCYKKTILNINKYPKEMNFFREHMLCLS